MERSHVMALIPLPSITREALGTRYVLHMASDGVGSIGADVPLGRIAGVVTNGTTGLSAQLIGQMPALEVINAFGVGYENVDLAAAAARGIVVTNAPGTNDETVADHALGFMLALSRGYGVLSGMVRAGGWKNARAARPSLNGAAVGIIGMGRIGQGIARRAQAFGMRVMYCTRNPRTELPFEYAADLLAMAEASDYLVTACPGGPETWHIVNAKVLAALGREGFLVNVARGSVVNTFDLVDALQKGTIAGAGLDVLESEPEVPREILDMDNVLITPHMAGRSPAAQRAQTAALLESLEAVLNGRQARFAVV